MAKKSRDVNELLRYSRQLLDSVGETKKEAKKAVRETKGCKNHPEKLVYKSGLCKSPCYEEYSNSLNKKNAEREPWITSNGYKMIYREDGSIVGYHRYVVEQAIGRRLQRSEQVKFVDDNKLNCELSNLRLVCDTGIDLSTLICVNCGLPATHSVTPNLPQNPEEPSLTQHP